MNMSARSNGAPAHRTAEPPNPSPLATRFRLELAARVHRALRGTAISAMVRVRNEEEFLRPAIESIAELVDEIVLVDNLSTDATPAIIADLARAYRGKVVSASYSYPVRRVGHETAELAGSHGAHASPHLSANFYNWCLQRCSRPFVLKWDGDMIALPGFARSLASWRRSRRPVLMLQGMNVHPDRRHLLAARCDDRHAIERHHGIARLPRWTSILTTDIPEPRLFPRLGAAYDSAAGYTQSNASPFVDSRFAESFRLVAAAPVFLHMKFCKRAPFSNYCDDMAAAIAGNICRGPAIDRAGSNVLRRFGLAEPPG